MKRLAAAVLCLMLFVSGCSDSRISADEIDLAGELEILLNPTEDTTPGGIVVEGILDHSKPNFNVAWNEIPERVSIDLCAFGDIMAHDGTYTAAKNENGYDFDFMFAEVAGYTVGADYVVGNLETCFAGAGRKYTGYPLFNTPEQMGESMRRVLGLNLVSAANNHIMDRGFSGIEATLDNLDAMGIAHTGAYRSQEEADKTFIADIKGAKIAFLSYTYGVNNGVPKTNPYAVNVMSKDKLRDAADKAREDGADYVIALLHWGTEYLRDASREQRELAEWLFENTEINLIIGNHPHVVEPFEKFEVVKDGHKKTGWVLYALGNFTSAQHYEYSDTGIIAHIQLTVDTLHNEYSTVDAVTYTPIYVDTNALSTGKRYRVISMSNGIAAYENGTDPLISKQEYRDMIKYTEYYREFLCTDELIREVE